LIGFTNDLTGGYNAGMWLFSTLGFAGLFFAFMLKKADRETGGGHLEDSKMV